MLTVPTIDTANFLAVAGAVLVASALLFLLIKSLYRITLFVYLNVIFKIAGFIMKV